MRRALLGAAAGLALVLVMPALGGGNSAEAVIHEIVAAYCSGGDVGVIDLDGELEAPGLMPGGSNGNNVAKPVLASGAVVVTNPPPALEAEIGDSPAAKYPAGTNAFRLGDPDHASADNCKALNP